MATGGDTRKDHRHARERCARRRRDRPRAQRAGVYEAKFRYGGAQVKRRLGPAWLEPDGAGGWRKRKGRTPKGSLDQRTATLAAAELVAAYVRDADEVERVQRERRTRGITFAQLAADYLHWLEHDYEAKPATLKNYGYALADTSRIMRVLGDRPAAEITSDEIRALLAAIGESGAGPRTVNVHRNMIRAIFNFGIKRAVGYRLTENPAVGIDSRREREPSVLAFYTPMEIEAIAHALTQDATAAARCAPGLTAGCVASASALTGQRTLVTIRNGPKTPKTVRRSASPPTAACARGAAGAALV